jgi:hypothetical protein
MPPPVPDPPDVVAERGARSRARGASHARYSVGVAAACPER